MTKETLKIWDGYPLIRRDRDGWHLLKLLSYERPEPFWYCARYSIWKLQPDGKFHTHAKDMPDVGYSYVACAMQQSDIDELAIYMESPELVEALNDLPVHHPLFRHHQEQKLRGKK